MEAIPAQVSARGGPAHVLLRKARREAGLSHNEVARQMGMAVLEYYRAAGESDEGSVTTLAALRHFTD